MASGFLLWREHLWIKNLMRSHGIDVNPSYWKGESAETFASENKGHLFWFGPGGPTEGLCGMWPEGWIGRVECLILPGKDPVFSWPDTPSLALSGYSCSSPKPGIPLYFFSPWYHTATLLPTFLVKACCRGLSVSVLTPPQLGLWGLSESQDKSFALLKFREKSWFLTFEI